MKYSFEITKVANFSDLKQTTNASAKIEQFIALELTISALVEQKFHFKTVIWLEPFSVTKLTLNKL